jgi:hypothetical protein
LQRQVDACAQAARRVVEQIESAAVRANDAVNIRQAEARTGRTGSSCQRATKRLLERFGFGGIDAFARVAYYPQRRRFAAASERH